MTLAQEMNPIQNGRLFSGSVIIEEPNHVASSCEKLAYDVGDVEARYLRLRNKLSETELKRLAGHDELEALVSHVAEIENVEITPYRLSVIDGRLASITLIEADKAADDRQDGKSEEILIVRFLTDMLKSRLNKHPGDKRGMAVLKAFEEKIEPKAYAMPIGGRLVFFSPPESGGNFENEYGFMYLLEKHTNEDTSLEELGGLAVKLDLKPEEYCEILRQNRPNRRQTAAETDDYSYAEIVGECIYFHDIKTENEVSLLSRLLAGVRGDDRGELFLDGHKIEDIADWIGKETQHYQEIRQRIQAKTDNYAEDLIGGRGFSARESLEQIQIESIRVTNPKLWTMVMQGAERSGSFKISLPCGEIKIEGKSGVGFADPWSNIMRGINDEISDAENDSEEYSYNSLEYCVVHNPKKIIEIGKSWCGPCHICENCDRILRSKQFNNG